MEPMYEELPSGKKILRQFHTDGQLASEMHFYGAVDIALTRWFSKGAKVGETFIVNNRLVSRPKYEKAREKFADMPLPDISKEDISGKLITAVGREKREARKAKVTHQPNQEKGRETDAFCLAMMRRGQSADAVEWIASPSHTLGEMSHADSRKLAAKLHRLGCKQIHACEIDCCEDGDANTGHLVLELPVNPEVRKTIFRELDRLANKIGYTGNGDDGQQYAYVKLD